MGDRYDVLRPNQITASIASLPSRWRGAFRIDPDLDIDIEDLFTVAAKDGTSLAEHCAAVIAQLGVLRDAIRTTTYPVPETLDDQVAAAVANRGSGPWPSSAREALNAISAELNSLSEQLRLVKTNDWKKAATCGGTSFTVIQLAQGTSRVAADRLRAVEYLVAELT